MNILFCVQTIFEMDNPRIYVNFLTVYFKKYIENILKVDPGAQITLLMGEAASYCYQPMPNVTAVVVTQDEMLNYGKFEKEQLLCEYFRYCHERCKRPESMDYHINLLRERLKCNPDIIISRDNSPYLEEVFPKALCVYTEVGFVSRKPFNLTMYFDCVGMNCGSYLYANWEQEKKRIDWDEKKEQSVCKLQEGVVRFIGERNPYKEKAKLWREKHDKLFLLPLQFSGFANVDGELEYNSQMDVLMEIMNHVPADVGVIVTTHPDYNIMNARSLSFLRTKYPNLIYDDDFGMYLSSSQYIIEFCDGVINLSSTVGLQAIFWNKPCITVGKYFAHYAGRNFQEGVSYEPLTDEEIRNNQQVLYWLLTHYIIPEKYYLDAEWFYQYLQKMVARHQKGDQYLYEQFAEIDTIAEDMIAGLDVFIPEKRQIPKANQYYNLLVKCTNKFFGQKKIMEESILGGRDVLIYGKGSFAYLLLQELHINEEFKKHYKGLIDYTNYREYNYTGKELIVVTPIQEYKKIYQDLRKVTVADIVSIEDILEE